jgi:trigger factor
VKTDVENLSTTRVKIVVEIPFDELAEDLQNAYRSIGAQVNVPGFRKGKVPSRIIDQRFGRGTVLSEVANAVIPRTYEKVVTDEEIIPLGQPKIEVTKLEDGDLMEFVAEVDVRPDFELPDPSAIEVQVDAIAVADDAVAEELEELRKRFASFTDVTRGAAEGDVILVDVAAADADGNPVEAFAAADMSYEVGSGGAVEGFDEAVAGAVAEEVRTFEHIPAEGDQAGTALTVAVTVKGVRERELPAADDDFAQLASEFDTIEELRDDLRERLRRTKLFELGADARTKVRDAYLDSVEMDLPDGIIEEQLTEHFSDGHGDDDHRAETEAELRTNLKANLVLDKLAEERDVRVEEAELSQWLLTQAQRYGMSPDQFAKALVDAGQVQGAVGEVRRAKALSLVVEAAAITDSEGNAVDLDEIARLLSGEPEIEELDAELDEDADLDAELDAAEAEEDAATAKADDES